MAYVTSTEIAFDIKNIDFTTPDTPIGTTEVDEFISQEEAVVNLTISNRYIVPVVDAESIKILKRITTAFVVFRVAKVLNLKKDIPIPENMVVQDLSEGSFYITAKKQLDNIRDGVIVLQDAEAVSLGQGVESFVTNENVEPIWIRDKRQW